MNKSYHLGRPSLQSIRVFDAAARHLNFTAAAEELGLTQSAVSKHISGMEEDFQQALFERRGPVLRLTEAGLSYHGRIAEPLAVLREATIAMHRQHIRRNTLTISVLPSVASLWLTPLIVKFTEAHPEIDLKIHASRDLVDFTVHESDVAIRYGKGAWPTLDAFLLSRETLTPVCSPTYAQKHGLTGPEKLGPSITLLSDDLADDWAAWFQSVGMSAAGKRFGARFTETASLYEAAAEGAGLALGRSLLVKGIVRDGRLVAPFGHVIPASYQYYLVMPKSIQRKTSVVVFKKWIMESMAGFDAHHEEL